MNNYDRAKQLRASSKAWASTLDDKEASEVPSLYDGMKYDGHLIEVNTRILWGDALKRAAVDLWDREENNPDNAPALWDDIAYKDGYRIIPEHIPATDPFSNGERGWWKDELYKSLANNNTYTPEQYPTWWTKELE